MDHSFSPKPFYGKVGEDVETFLQEFDKYVAYREMDETKALALLRLLLKGSAGEWLDRLNVFSKNDMGRLKAAITERYARSKIVKHKTARELFSRKQGADEEVDAFVGACVKLSSSFGTESEAMAMYAIMGGLRPPLAAFVAQKQPESLKELIEQARLAELTVNPVTDHQMLDQMSEVKAAIQRLGEKLEKATTLQPVSNTTPEEQRRSRPQYRPRPAAGGYSQRSREQRDDATSSSKDVKKDEGQKDGCSRCGYPGGHENPNRCRAFNQTCNFCSKVGHFARCCYKAKRYEQQRGQAQAQE